MASWPTKGGIIMDYDNTNEPITVNTAPISDAPPAPEQGTQISLTITGSNNSRAKVNGLFLLIPPVRWE
jgi:hypothetical protein